MWALRQLLALNRRTAIYQKPRYQLAKSPYSQSLFTSIATEKQIAGKNLIKQKIGDCANGKQISEVIRFYPKAFEKTSSLQLMADRIRTLLLQHKIIHNPREVAGLLNALSRIYAKGTTRDLQRRLVFELSDAVWTKHQGKVFFRKTRDISMVFNALAKTNTKNEALIRQLAENAKLQISDFNAQDLSNTVNALAKLCINDSQLLDAAANSSIEKIDEFTPLGLATLTNGFAKLNHAHPRLFDSIAHAAIPIIYRFSAQGLALTVNGFAKLDHPSPKLFDAVARTAPPIISTFSSQHLANTANAFAKMNYRDLVVLDAIGRESVARMNEFNAQELSNIVHAYAKIKYDVPNMFRKAAKAATPILHTFNTLELAMLVNAGANWNEYDPKLWDDVAKEAILKLSTTISIHLEAPDLAILANAFARMKHHHPDLFDQIAFSAQLIIGSFQPQNLAILANAFGKMDYSHPELFETIALKSLPIISDFNPQELANLLSGFARIGAAGKEVSNLFSATKDWLKQNRGLLSRWEERNLVELMYAFLKARKTDLKLLELVGNELIDRPDLRLDAHGLGNLAAIYSRVEVEQSAKVLKLIFEKFQDIPRDEIELRNVADICKSLWIGQRLNVFPPNFLRLLVGCAIQKSHESVPADVRDLLLNLASSKIHLDHSSRKELLETYKPIFREHSKHIAPVHCKKILKMYKKS